MNIIQMMLNQQDAYIQGKEAAQNQLSPHCPLDESHLRKMWHCGYKDAKFELLESKEY